MPDVFISYSRQNLEFVQQIVTALKQSGKDAWFDQLKEPLLGIAAGAPWWKQIQDGIENVDNFLFVVSPNSIRSPYCHAEINHAREHGKRLVPLLYCGWIGEAETRKTIDAAIEAIPDTEEIPGSVTSSILNLKKLVRANWLAISEIQYVVFASSTPFERSLEQLVQALDLDLAWVRMHSQLTQAAKLWEANDFDADFLWGTNRLKSVREMIERRKPVLDSVVQEFIKPEQERLLRELETLPKTAASHERRRDIGDRLSVIGDTRRGVGVKDGIPDIAWLPVEGSAKPVEFHDKDGEAYGPFVVHPFYIAKYQVTYTQYQVFINAEDGFNNSTWWTGMPEEFQQQLMGNQRTISQNNPRDSVSWYQSVAFTRWLDAKLREAHLLPDEKLIVRLPTEWEWQWAAQAGEEERIFSWGYWQEGYANTREAGLSRAVAVGMYPHGEATCKALDMSGNVFEWCLNDYEDLEILDGYGNGKHKVVRGSSFYLNRYEARVSFRGSYDPYKWDPNFGFRVVLGSPIGQSGL